MTSSPCHPKNCANCGKPIPEARRAALPEETWCRECVEASGDVERVRGAMTWEHKTAPTIVIGPASDTIRRYDRRGFHASLPLNSYENPRLQASRRAQQELQDVKAIIREEPDPRDSFDTLFHGPSVPMSRCHPDKPRVTPDGKCVDCAVTWYAMRVK